jgi:hypothetical protein
MKSLFRNFFYAVGATLLLYMYSLNSATASFGDLVRLVQSESARNVVMVLTILLWGLDMATSGFGAAVCISLPRGERRKKRDIPSLEEPQSQNA